MAELLINFDSSALSTYAICIFGAASVFSAYFLHHTMNASKDINSSKKNGRRMSFNSVNLASGPFPRKVLPKDAVVEFFATFKDINDCPSPDDFLPIVEQLMSQVDRMAAIPKQYGGIKEWHFEMCRKIDPKQMVRTINVNHDNFDGMINEVQNVFDNCQLSSKERNLPWWEFCLIRNSGKSESILMWRVHHAIGDGMSLGMIASMFVTRVDGSSLGDMIPPSMRSSKKLKRKMSFGKMLMNTTSAFMEIAASPVQRFDHATAFTNKKIGITEYSNRRRIIIFDPYPLSYIKEVKDRANATVNDILHTALGQAIRYFCEHSDCPVIKKHGKKTRCRTLLAVGIPSDFPSGQNGSLNEACGNRWVPLSLDLGIGYDNLQDRLDHIKKRTIELKEKPLVAIQLALQNVILPMLPRFVSRHTAHSVYARHSISTSNVPGPNHQIFIAGKPVSSCRFFVVNLHDVISLLSYNGSLYVTMLVDDEATPDIHLLPKFFTRALIDLGEEFNVEIPQSLQS